MEGGIAGDAKCSLKQTRATIADARQIPSDEKGLDPGAEAPESSPFASTRRFVFEPQGALLFFPPVSQAFHG